MTYTNADLLRRLKAAQTNLAAIVAELRAHPASGPEMVQATAKGLVPMTFDITVLAQELLDGINIGLEEIEEAHGDSDQLAQARPVLEVLLGQLASNRDLFLGTLNARRVQRGLPVIDGFGTPDN